MGAWGHRVLCLRRTSEQAAVAKMRLPWSFGEQFCISYCVLRTSLSSRTRNTHYYGSSKRDAQTEPFAIFCPAALRVGFCGGKPVP